MHTGWWWWRSMDSRGNPVLRVQLLLAAFLTGTILLVIAWRILRLMLRICWLLARFLLLKPAWWAIRTLFLITWLTLTLPVRLVFMIFR